MIDVDAQHVFQIAEPNTGVRSGHFAVTPRQFVENFSSHEKRERFGDYVCVILMEPGADGNMQFCDAPLMKVNTVLDVFEKVVNSLGEQKNG